MNLVDFYTFSDVDALSTLLPHSQIIVVTELFYDNEKQFYVEKQKAHFSSWESLVFQTSLQN